MQPLGGELSSDNDETEALQWFPPDQLPQLAFPYPAAVLEGQRSTAYFKWKDEWLAALV